MPVFNRVSGDITRDEAANIIIQMLENVKNDIHLGDFMLSRFPAMRAQFGTVDDNPEMKKRLDTLGDNVRNQLFRLIESFRDEKLFPTVIFDLLTRHSNYNVTMDMWKTFFPALLDRVEVFSSIPPTGHLAFQLLADNFNETAEQSLTLFGIIPTVDPNAPVSPTNIGPLGPPSRKNSEPKDTEGPIGSQRKLSDPKVKDTVTGQVRKTSDQKEKDTVTAAKIENIKESAQRGIPRVPSIDKTTEAPKMVFRPKTESSRDVTPDKIIGNAKNIKTNVDNQKPNQKNDDRYNENNIGSSQTTDKKINIDNQTTMLQKTDLGALKNVGSPMVGKKTVIQKPDADVANSIRTDSKETKKTTVTPQNQDKEFKLTKFNEQNKLEDVKTSIQKSNEKEKDETSKTEQKPKNLEASPVNVAKSMKLNDTPTSNFKTIISNDTTTNNQKTLSSKDASSGNFIKSNDTSTNNQKTSSKSVADHSFEDMPSVEEQIHKKLQEQKSIAKADSDKQFNISSVAPLQSLVNKSENTADFGKKIDYGSQKVGAKEVQKMDSTLKQSTKSKEQQTKEADEILMPMREVAKKEGMKAEKDMVASMKDYSNPKTMTSSNKGSGTQKTIEDISKNAKLTKESSDATTTTKKPPIDVGFSLQRTPPESTKTSDQKTSIEPKESRKSVTVDFYNSSKNASSTMDKKTAEGSEKSDFASESKTRSSTTVRPTAIVYGKQKSEPTSKATEPMDNNYSTNKSKFDKSPERKPAETTRMMQDYNSSKTTKADLNTSTNTKASTNQDPKLTKTEDIRTSYGTTTMDKYGSSPTKSSAVPAVAAAQKFSKDDVPLSNAATRQKLVQH